MIGRVGSTVSVSQSISHPSVFSCTNIPTGTDVIAGSHTWSAGASGFSSGMDVAAGSGSGSLAGIGSGLLSWVWLWGGDGWWVGLDTGSRILFNIAHNERRSVDP